MSELRLLVINSTTREGRFSDHVARWVVDGVRRRTGAEVELLDLRDHPLPFFDGVPPAKSLRDYPNDAVRQLGEKLDAADGFVILAAEYNHGYTAVLKNILDWTFPEWRRKPVSFVGWGNVGGARAIEQLREVSVELEMAPLRHAVHILPPQMIDARGSASDEASDEAFAALEPKLDLLAADLAWWAQTLRTGRRAELVGAA
jgi:NAD(P)H-dependent FMN reductase